MNRKAKTPLAADREARWRRGELGCVERSTPVCWWAPSDSNRQPADSLRAWPEASRCCPMPALTWGYHCLCMSSLSDVSRCYPSKSMPYSVPSSLRPTRWERSADVRMFQPFLPWPDSGWNTGASGLGQSLTFAVPAVSPGQSATWDSGTPGTTSVKIRRAKVPHC